MTIMALAALSAAQMMPVSDLELPLQAWRDKLLATLLFLRIFVNFSNSRVDIDCKGRREGEFERWCSLKNIYLAENICTVPIFHVSPVQFSVF